jgi:hypothetical protein
MGWHGPRGECGCCGDISSSSSPSASSSSSLSSSSSVINPCDCSTPDITYYLKIEINIPSELETYGTQGFTTLNCPICRIAARTLGFPNGTGTYFIPLVRQCISADEIKFVLGAGSFSVGAGVIQTASCAFGVNTFTNFGNIEFNFGRRSATLNQLLDITFVRPPFSTGASETKTIDIANLNLCGVAPVLSGSITWTPTTLTLENPPGSAFGDPCTVTVQNDFEPLLWEIVPGVV